MGLFAGTARGLHWKGVEDVGEMLVASGTCRAVVLPTTEPRNLGTSRLAFRARLYTVEDGDGQQLPLRQGSLVEVIVPNGCKDKVLVGSPITGTGKFTLPSQAMNPGDYDHRQRLNGDQVFHQFECYLVGEHLPGRASRIQEFWYRSVAFWRRTVSEAIDAFLPEEEGCVLKGVFLGDREGFSRDASDEFRRSGFYRFVAIAGFHISLAHSIVENWGRKFTGRPSLARWTAAVAAFAYATLSGWTPGVIRAFICCVMRSFAPALRRNYHPLAGLSMAAGVLAWVVPYPLLHPGLQMSLMAASAGVAGARCFPSGQRKESRLWHPALRGIHGILSGVRRALLLCLVILPIMATGFREVSLAGFLFSGLWVAAMRAIIPLSVLVILTPRGGRLLGFLPYMLIRAVRLIVAWAASWPWASWIMPAPSGVEIAAYYGLIGLFLWSKLRGGADRGASNGVGDSLGRGMPNDVGYGARDGVGDGSGYRTCNGGGDAADARNSIRSDVGGSAGHGMRHNACICVGPRRRRAFSAVMAVLLAGTLVVCAYLRASPPWPEVTFISVGQGDCALVRLGRFNMLVDTGVYSACDISVVNYLKRLGINRLDICALSHLHNDHAGGITALCREISVARIVTSPGTSGLVAAMLLGQKMVGDPPLITEASSGRVFQAGGLAIATFCESPSTPLRSLDDVTNEHSVVMVVWGEAKSWFAIEFWGDAPASLVSRCFSFHHAAFFDSETKRVIKVPHHGSKDSLVAGFYDRAAQGLPEGAGQTEPGGIAVVCVGRNSYGHPSDLVSDAALAAGVPLYRTDLSGAVSVRLVRGKIVVKTFR